MDFDDINAVKLWMISNQRGRRNLNDGWKYELELVRKVILLEIGAAKSIQAGKEGGRGNKKGLSIVDKPFDKPEYHGKECPECEFYCWKTDDNCPDCGYAFIYTPEPESESPKHNTQKSTAESLGWSTGKVAMADKVWKDATPEIKAQVLSGEVSINEAYKAVKSGNTHVSKNSGENEWYTPKQFIDAARLIWS